MAKNKILSSRNEADINRRIERVLKDLGNPEPPLRLDQVRELLKIDFGYYSASDPGLLQETVHRFRKGGHDFKLKAQKLIQVVKKFDLRALFIPAHNRILLDKDEPTPKHRWNEAHEVAHSLFPWHEGAMLGDDKDTLVPSCHDELEGEANFGAGRLLFLQERFTQEALALERTIDSVKFLAQKFGNTNTSTFWRCVETWGQETPIVGLITGHPHPDKRASDFDPAKPCKHFIQSRAFAAHFSKIPETDTFDQVADYCTRARGGPLGSDRVQLTDDNGDHHIFEFETFNFFHSVLTLGIYVERKPTFVAMGTGT